MATQTELAEIWAEKEGIGVQESYRIISSLVDTMRELILEGDEVKLRGLLTARMDIFEPKTFKNFMGRGDLNLPRRHKLVMKPSSKLRQQVKSQAV